MLPLINFLRILWKRMWIVLLAAIVGTGAAVGFSLAQTPVYEASIMMLVGQERGITQSPSEVMGLQQLTQTMAQAVNSRTILNEVIQRQNLSITAEEAVDDNLSVEQINATQFIEVRYRDTSPERAQRVANEIGEVFSERVSDVSPSASGVTVTVWEQAAEPEAPVSPNLVLNVAMGLALGVLLGLGIAFLLEHLDDRWRSPEEAEQISGVPTFGVIPEFPAREISPKGRSKEKR